MTSIQQNFHLYNYNKSENSKICEMLSIKNAKLFIIHGKKDNLMEKFLQFSYLIYLLMKYKIIIYY